MLLSARDLCPILMLLLTTTFKNIHSKECGIEKCTDWLVHSSGYETSVPGSERLCQIVATYLNCLNDTSTYCRGSIAFYSSKTIFEKDFKKHGCHRYDRSKEDVNRCHVPSFPARSIRYCSLFGDPHLRRFDGVVETCSEEGARPLVDNRYFLVQVTNSRIRNEPLTTAVNKVTVLIRRHNCTRLARFQAEADQEHLPISFVDGVTHLDGDMGKRAVEVLVHDTNYVEIAMRHIDSSVHIRRQGPYLSVAVRLPEHVMQSYSPNTQQLCVVGCRREGVLSIGSALSDPKTFARCHARTIHVPKRLAVDRCKTVKVTDSFFDACVFDLMLTGDEYLVAMSRDAQSDMLRLFPAHHHYTQNRTDLSIYSDYAPPDEMFCLSNTGSKIQSNLQNIMIPFIITLLMGIVL